MAEQNPIRYSDLIQPDSSITELVKQLDEANDAYNNLAQNVKSQAQQMAQSLTMVSGATAGGRSTIRAYSQDAEKLLKAEKDLNFARSETARKIAELNEMKKRENTITKLNVQLAEASEGSYKALSAQYSLNKIRLNELTEAERKNTEYGKKLEQETYAIYQKMKELQEATGKHQLNVGNYDGAIQNLTKDLRAMVQQLAQMEAEGKRGSAEYEALARQAGALKDNIADARAEVQRYSSDTRLISDAVDVVTTATAAYQTWQGAVQAFGVESEEAMQAMAKLQGILSVTNGLQQLAKKFTDNSTATYKIYHAILRLVGLEEKAVAAATITATTAEEAQTAAVETQTVANTANTASISATTVALKALKVALLTTGIGAVVVALGALVAYWDDIKEFFGGMTKEAKAAAETMNTIADATQNSYKEYAKAKAELSVYQDRVNSFNGTKKQEKQLVEELNDKYGTALGKYGTLNEWKQRLKQSGEAYCQQLQKEAELTELVSAYQDAYLEKLQIQRKWQEGDYKSWYKTEAGELRDYNRDLDAVDTRMQTILDRMKGVAHEVQNIRSAYNIGDITTTTTPNGKKDKKDDTAAKEAKIAQERLAILQKTEDIKNSMIEDEFNREWTTVTLNYTRQIEALRERAAKEVELREQLNAQIAALEEKRSAEQAKILAKYSEKDAAAKKKQLEDQQKQKEQVFRQQQDVINAEAEIRDMDIDMLETSEKEKTRLRLEAEKDRLQKLLALYQANGKVLTDTEKNLINKQIETVNHELEQNKKNDKDIYDVLGFNLSDEKKEAINTSLSYAMDGLSQFMQAYTDAANKKRELADAEVERTQNVLQAELEARAKGYANDVETARKEVAEAKKNQQKAIEQQKKAQKAQIALDTAAQAANLITATSLIWKQLGFPWAIPALAVMWGSFAAAKVKAIQAAGEGGDEKYAEGTVELLEGGSHQSGNDIDLGRKKNGTRRRAEGGEFFAVINKRNSRKYRNVIPDVIHSLNSGTFADKYLNAYDGGAMAVQPIIQNGTDLTRLQDDVQRIREQGERTVYVDGQGRTVMVYKNVRRILKS